MGDPDLMLRLQAASGALMQFALVIAALVIWRFGELVVMRLGCRWIMSGQRRFGEGFVRAIGLIGGALVTIAIVMGLLGLFVWSFAALWTFPNALPDGFTMRSWMRHSDGILEATSQAELIALIATSVALILVIGCLEAEHRYGLRMSKRGVFLLYLPLMIPQTAFLPGLQTLLLSARLEMGMIPVILAHLVFVLPYVFLSLSDPFRAWDQRFGTLASALGSGPNGVLWRVRLPMLLGPLLTAFAVGFAVSVGQYLPTLLVGGGRIETLTTEAVALAAGGDRRAIGVYGLMQTGAAIVPFALAVLLPLIVWRNRKGLQNG